MKFFIFALLLTSSVTSFAEQNNGGNGNGGGTGGRVESVAKKEGDKSFMGITDCYFPGLIGGSFGGVKYHGIQREMTECHKDPNEPNVIHCPDGDYTKSAGVSNADRYNNKEIPTGSFGMGSSSTAGAVGQ